MSDGKGELILYRTENGRADIQLHAADGTTWLTQLELAEPFDISRQNVARLPGCGNLDAGFAVARNVVAVRRAERDGPGYYKQACA